MTSLSFYLSKFNEGQQMDLLTLNLLELEITWKYLRTRKSVSLKLDPYSAIYIHLTLNSLIVKITDKDNVFNLPITIHNAECGILKHQKSTFEVEFWNIFNMQGTIESKNAIFLLDFCKTCWHKHQLLS